MAFTHTNTRSVRDDGGRTIERSSTYSGGASVDIAETIVTASTDFLINIAIDVSAVKSFYIVSDVAVTVETNSGSAADNTLVLKAGVPYQWDTDSYDTFKLTADVTKIYVTNVSGSTSNLFIKCIQDPTP